VSNQVVLDSIQLYRQYSKDKQTFSDRIRLSFAERARILSKEIQIDTTIISSNRRISTVYWELGYFDLFRKINIENRNLSEKIKDSVSLGKANYNLGVYFREKTITVDSAYYYFHKAEKIYRGLNERFDIVSALLEIAAIQRDEKDFTGSEVTSIDAISILEGLEQTNIIRKYTSFFYNNLGMVFAEMEQYEESILYYKKAIALQEKLSGDNTEDIEKSRNNLARSYKNSGKYKLALEIYNEILDNKNMKRESPDIYAVVLDNYAHTLFLSGDFTQLPGLYLKSLKISDSLGSNYFKIIIHQHLAEYYNKLNKKDSALFYAYSAKNISEQYHNDDLLKSLLLLSKIETDSVAVKYYDEYIKLNDSLVKIERNVRNKFARIRFETQEVEQRNKEISRERLWLLIISIILLISALLIYIIITQRSKNKELRFVQKQQEANEEIYNLMLSQQDKIEEARVIEKKNISQELHDGVLGRLFGTRLSLDSLNMASSEEAINTRSKYIQDLKKIEEDIRKVSHELNTDFIGGSGFLSIIKTLLENQIMAYQLKYEFNYDDAINWEDVSNKKKIHIYRIIQESLHNIYKHASATSIKIGIHLKNNVILLRITDDGSGFDVEKSKSGIGLKNINSRVNEINGELSINSKKGEGTTVEIQVPI
jgi:signal transduction histidine kinase